MAWSTDSTFRNAAKNAAERWKDPTNQTEALRQQIMDSFRLTKRIQEAVGSLGTFQPVRQAWKDAFRDVGCPDDFNFDDDQLI